MKSDADIRYTGLAGFDFLLHMHLNANNQRRQPFSGCQLWLFFVVLFCSAPFFIGIF